MTDGFDQPMPKIEVVTLIDEVPDELEGTIRAAVGAIVHDAGFGSFDLSIAIVSDATIQQANRQYLDHDYPTDVLSFRLDEYAESSSSHAPSPSEQTLEGEVLVSWDTACRQAALFDWAPSSECLLYVVHGTLHLIGHDDRDEHDRQEMRKAERAVLATFGLAPHYDRDVSETAEEEAGS
ncbi:MAG TPA: rRNA maturation RNase YbeY [Planctomycetes bacterium]|nr:rRNA maturation RNase YbeY [Planctomycetaceae bacterium]HIM28133.1 rRNA maturation RNase YbeY [Planctomycetota bacterium]